MVFSFEWAHNPQVPGSYLTLLIIRSDSQIHFQVWRKNEFHQSDVFQDLFQIIFHCWLNLFGFFILPEYLNNSWWCFFLSFSNSEDPRRVPLKYLPVLSEIHDSSVMPSSHNCFRLWEFFSPIHCNSGVCSVWFSGAHHLRIIHSQLVALVLQILPVHRSNIL